MFRALPAGQLTGITKPEGTTHVVGELFDFRRRPARISPDVLAPSPVLLYEPGGNTRRIVDEWLARSGTSLKPLMSLGSVEAIKGMVKAGLGCAVLPGMVVADKESEGELVVRSLTPKLSRRLCVIVREDKRLDLGLRKTLAALKSLSAAERPIREQS